MMAELDTWCGDVPPEIQGERLDRWIAATATHLSRSYVQQLIGDGHVLVNGRPGKASMPVKWGDRVVLTLPLPAPSALEAEDIPLAVRYEDNDIVVVDKPAGMVVHPAPGHIRGTLVNALLFHYPTMRTGNDLRPGIVHRIDMDTSGLLVVAKHDRARAVLQEQQQARQMRKIYLALVEGHFDPSEGVIDAPIDRHPVDRLRQAVVPDGRMARTHYRELERLGPYSLVEARLETGRTHQIRVHFTYKQHPIVGDSLYGRIRTRPALDLRRQFLHAYCLGFRRLDGEWVEVMAPLPPDLHGVLEQLQLQYALPVDKIDPDRPWWQ
ncbi:MAG: RluA family pseudouridine synthase [Herpetosiphon sp.]